MQTTLTRIFIVFESVSLGLSENGDGISRKARKFKPFFRPKTGALQKKKRSLPKLSLIFRPRSEIQTFFQPKNRWSPKKKRSSPKLSLIFRPKFGQNLKFKRFFTPNRDIYFTTSAPNFLYGGAVFNFSPNIGLKSNKNVQFRILHKPRGVLEPPRPPGYATV